MALLRLLLLVSAVLPLAHCYPFNPPTCYSKVLSMGGEATQWASYLKRAYETVSPHPALLFLTLPVSVSVVFTAQLSAEC